VILDETSYTPGPKVADALSQAGHAIEIVTRQYSLGEDIGTTLRAKLLERLLRQGVTITVLAEPVAIGADYVRLRHMLTDAEWAIPANTVVLASGGQARDQLYHELVALTAGHENAPTLHLIGDAYAPRTLLLAMPRRRPRGSLDLRPRPLAVCPCPRSRDGASLSGMFSSWRWEWASDGA
jgi:hypothetical protein